MKLMCAIWSLAAQIGWFCPMCQTATGKSLVLSCLLVLKRWRFTRWASRMFCGVCVPLQVNLKGYLFHICRDVQVEERRVSYLDLLLDIWIGSDGVVEVLDREDVEVCYGEGKLCEADLKTIAAEEKRIVTHWPVLVREMDALLSDL